MYELLIDCLTILESIFDYEYETGIEFKCIDNNTKPEQYKIFKEKIIPVISNNDLYKRVIAFIKYVEETDDLLIEQIEELNKELDDVNGKYNKIVDCLKHSYKLLCRSGINSKKHVKEQIKNVLENVKK